MSPSIAERIMPVDTVLEVTLTLVLVYLILSNAAGFASVMGSLSKAYTSSVQALQGRQEVTMWSQIKLHKHLSNRIPGALMRRFSLGVSESQQFATYKKVHLDDIDTNWLLVRPRIHRDVTVGQEQYRGPVLMRGGQYDNANYPFHTPRSCS